MKTFKVTDGEYLTIVCLFTVEISAYENQETPMDGFDKKQLRKLTKLRDKLRAQNSAL